MKKIAVVAPTFNEEESIDKFLASVIKEQKNLTDYRLDIVISDSHSSDQTASRVKAAARQNSHVHLVDSKPGPGRLGLGLTDGLDYAVNKLKADYLVTLEADLTEDPHLIPKFIDDLKTFDVVIGSRYAPGGKIMNWTWWRRVLSLLANFALQTVVFNFQVHEYTNLYRAFRAEVWQTIRPRVGFHLGWLFVPAFIFEVLRAKFKIIEEPIIYFDRLGGRSKMRTLSYTKNLIQYAIRYKLNKYGSLS